MKKLTVILLAIMLLTLTFTACAPTETPDTTTGGEGDATTAAPFEVDIAAIRTEMIAEFGATDSITIETEQLLDLYGIKAEYVKESASYMTMGGVFPQEIIMIEAKDEASAEAIVTLLENRLSEILAQSQNYDPENYALAQKCKVESRDGYITLFISAHNEAMSEMFWGK